MALLVRPLILDATEARTFLEIHHASIRGLAAKDYPAAVIEGWARPITEDYLNRFLENRDNEIRLIAEEDGKAVGLGCLVVESFELRACYVHPDSARCGVGTAIVGEIERVARENGLTELRLESSLTAEPFYKALGYEVVERHEHRLNAGVMMAAVKMRKALQ